MHFTTLFAIWLTNSVSWITLGYLVQQRSTAGLLLISGAALWSTWALFQQFAPPRARRGKDQVNPERYLLKLPANTHRTQGRIARTHAIR